MKSIMKIIKVILPAVLMLVLTYALHGGKNILDGIYIIFPLIYIVIGIMYLKWELVLSLILTSLAFIIPINLLYNMGSCVELLVIYNILSLAAYLISIKVKKKKMDK